MTNEIKLPNTMLFRKSGNCTIKNNMYKEIGNHRNVTRISMLLDFTLFHTKPSTHFHAHHSNDESTHFTPNKTRNAQISNQISSTWKRKLSSESKTFYITHPESESPKQIIKNKWSTSTKWNASPSIGAHSRIVSSSYMKYRKSRAEQIEDMLSCKLKLSSSSEFHPLSVSKTESKHKHMPSNIAASDYTSPIIAVNVSKKERVLSLQVPIFSEKEIIPTWLSDHAMFKANNNSAIDAYLLYKIFKKDKAIRTEEDKGIIFHFIKNLECLQQYTVSTRWMFIHILQQRAYKAEEVLLKKGEECNKYIIICQGSIERDYNGTKTIMHPGEVIGRKKFMSGKTMHSEYTTKESVKCMIIEEKHFNENIRVILQDISKSRSDFISTVALFKDWSQERLDSIMVGMIEHEFQAGDIIYTKGSASNYIYIVKEGALKLEGWCSYAVFHKYPVDIKQWAVAETKKKLMVAIKLLKPGSMFGFEELIKEEARETRVTATQKSVIWVIDGQLFKNGNFIIRNKQYRQGKFKEGIV